MIMSFVLNLKLIWKVNQEICFKSWDVKITENKFDKNIINFFDLRQSFRLSNGIFDAPSVLVPLKNLEQHVRFIT